MSREFVGRPPSIYAGLESLGITPDGKLTFGVHGSNLVMPVRNIPAKSKRLFRTDENGNPTPLSDDELALINKASSEFETQAAKDASSNTLVGNNNNVTPVSLEKFLLEHSNEENKGNEIQPPTTNKPINTPWYDFLKHPKNTPYEQEQMRNQGILRDAAIAAAMNKPVFYPEADTLSEPMAKLAGQQAGLAQSAMGQFTTRQGMAADMYKQVTNLANSYAAQSMQAKMAAQKLKANSDESANNAKVYEQQAAAVFGQMPKDMQDASKMPNFLEVVRSKHDEKALALAQQYDALKRSQAMLENDALSKNEQANSYLAKAKAFGDGVTNLDRDWNLGLNFNVGGVTPYDVKKTTQPVQFAGQDDVGRNEVPIATPSGFSAVGSVPPAASVPSTAKTATATPANASGGSGKGKLKFDTKTNSVYQVSSSEGSASADPLAKRIARLSLGKDVNIANFAARGSRLNLDTGFQAAKDQNAWLKELGAISTELSKDPKSVSKHKDFVFEVTKGGDQRFGYAASILNENLNIPKFKGLSPYKNAITNRSGEGRIGDLEMYYNKVESGLGLTKQELDDMQEILEKHFKYQNTNGIEKPIFENNGLKIKYLPNINPETGEQYVNQKGNKLYLINLDDSFK